jgi:hypothetical protein
VVGGHHRPGEGDRASDRRPTHTSRDREAVELAKREGVELRQDAGRRLLRDIKMRIKMRSGIGALRVRKAR